jgi:CHRD domain
VAGIGVAVAGLAMIATVSTPVASGRGRPLSADLTGAAEVPGPGDPDGTGRAEIRIHAPRGEVCYALTVKNITPATSAQIHFAPISCRLSTSRIGPCNCRSLHRRVRARPLALLRPSGEPGIRRMTDR